MRIVPPVQQVIFGLVEGAKMGAVTDARENSLIGWMRCKGSSFGHDRPRVHDRLAASTTRSISALAWSILVGCQVSCGRLRSSAEWRRIAKGAILLVEGSGKSMPTNKRIKAGLQTNRRPL